MKWIPIAPLLMYISLSRWACSHLCVTYCIYVTYNHGLPCRWSMIQYNTISYFSQSWSSLLWRTRELCVAHCVTCRFLSLCLSMPALPGLTSHHSTPTQTSLLQTTSHLASSHTITAQIYSFDKYSVFWCIGYFTQR